MRQVTFKSLLCKPTAWLSVAVMLFTLLTITGTGVASAHSRPVPTTPPTACMRVHNVNYSEACYIPSVVTSSWCGQNQYWPGTDGYGKPVDITKTDEHNMCVTVTYNFGYSFSSCDIYFYLPLSNQYTAVFNYTWHDSGGSHQGTINENTGIAGWNLLFSDSSATSLTFNDNDTPGNQYLAWGSSGQYSLEVFCA